MLNHPTGQITLSKLHLKRGALDKFRLPVDVIEGANMLLSVKFMFSSNVCGIKQDTSGNLPYHCTG